VRVVFMILVIARVHILTPTRSPFREYDAENRFHLQSWLDDYDDLVSRDHLEIAGYAITFCFQFFRTLHAGNATGQQR
jgi:hypothetical protein